MFAEIAMRLVVIVSETSCGLVGRHNLQAVRANSSRVARNASRSVTSRNLPLPF